MSEPASQKSRGQNALLVTLAVLGAAVVVLVLGTTLLMFLMTDPPEDPEVQPLEVVVNSRSRPDVPCLLNVDEVRAGSHPVSVIGESGYAVVRIVDEQDRVVFRTDNEGQRIETDEDGAITIVDPRGEGEGPAARLRSGTFTVECDPEEGEPGTATLEVLPARDGR